MNFSVIFCWLHSMANLTKSCNTVERQIQPKAILFYYVQKKDTFNTTLFLESLTTNEIFYKAIVQNDEPHIYTSGHLKRESRKIWRYSYRNNIWWIEPFIIFSILLPKWKGKTSLKICRAVTYSLQTTTTAA